MAAYPISLGLRVEQRIRYLRRHTYLCSCCLTALFCLVLVRTQALHPCFLPFLLTPLRLKHRLHRLRPAQLYLWQMLSGIHYCHARR